MKKNRYKIVIALFLCMMFISCGQNKEREWNKADKNTTETEENQQEMSYERISQEEARQLMEQEDGYIILDVRTEAEYEEGHISGAICIPNETILDEMLEELPNKEQLILVYCRSGNRSKQASQKLAELGYTNIKEFGGIIDWDGDIEK